MKLFHNPRCSTSRKTLDLLKEKGIEPEVVLYLTDTPTVKELTEVLDKLGIPALDLIRKKEAIFKDNFKGKEHSNAAWIKIMVENPKLIERPILINGDKAAIGRPPENVLEIV